MKNILSLLLPLLCYATAVAQSTDSTAVSTGWTRFPDRYDSIKMQYRQSGDSISAFKDSYKHKEKDAAYESRLDLLQAERLRYRTEYDLARRERSAWQRKREIAMDTMQDYYRKQPYFKYRNYSKYYLAGGITLVSTGGALMLGGLVVGMGEHMQPISKEQQRKENVTMIALCCTGAALALTSIPFFMAATVNKAKYRRHITWNLQLDAVPAIGGHLGNTIGLGMRVPLFQKPRGY